MYFFFISAHYTIELLHIRFVLRFFLKDIFSWKGRLYHSQTRCNTYQAACVYRQMLVNMYRGLLLFLLYFCVSDVGGTLFTVSCVDWLVWSVWYFFGQCVSCWFVTVVTTWSCQALFIILKVSYYFKYLAYWHYIPWYVELCLAYLVHSLANIWFLNWYWTNSPDSTIESHVIISKYNNYLWPECILKWWPYVK